MKENKKSVSTKRATSHCKALKETQEDFIMLPTVDFCFKELMQNDNIRKNIIAALLNVPSSEIEKTELMPTILRKESKDDKYGILDVRVKLKDGEQIDFEMQVEAFDCWANRSVYYLSKMYASEIKEGEGYDCLKKCIHVSILAYDHFLDDKECYRRIAFCDAKTGKEYTDLMEMHILELSKLGHTEDILKEVVENHKRQEKILFSLASCHPCRIPFFKPCCEKSHQYRNQIIHKNKYISKPGFLKQKGPDCCQHI